MAVKRMLINATQQDEIRVAITDGAQLIDLDIEVAGQEQKKSNIYRGIISSREVSLGAVFVNYGSERHGFLPLKEISHEYFLSHDPEQLENPDVRKVLKEGQPLVVQVEKEERGSKGAALTTFISLAGSFLVLMPNNPQAGGISRRIEGEERELLRDTINQLTVPDGMGVIIRTAGVGKSKEELEWDLNILLRYWEAIKQAATVKPGAYLIHQESDVVIRCIRDYLRQDIEEIIIDQEDAYERAYNYISQIRPDFINRLKLYKDSLPLFSRFQIEQQIETAYQREVRLPSGGSIVIDHTEALVSIDVNSARATKGGSIEETALNTNLEASEEIARQLRIRDIGGLVVIDFIDMTSVRNQREVESCLRNALRQDRARIQLGRISRFGLMEMSRQRIRSSLTKANHVTCPRCEGQGTIRSIESQAISIIHLVQEQAAKSRNLHFQIQLPLEVATYITNEKRDLLSQIEKQCQVKVTIIPNEFLESPHYQLKQIKSSPEHLEHGKGVVSYKLLKSHKGEFTAPPPKKTTTVKANNEPAITQFLTSMPQQQAPEGIPARPKPLATSSGLIKRLWTKMFGSDQASSMPKKPEAFKSPHQEHARHQQRRRPSQNRGRASQPGRRYPGQHPAQPQEQRQGQGQTQHHQGQGQTQHPQGQGQTQHHQGSGNKTRSRRGSRGGQHRNKFHGPKPGQHGSQEDLTSRRNQPYPEDIDLLLPKSEDPTVVSDHQKNSHSAESNSEVKKKGNENSSVD